MTNDDFFEYFYTQVLLPYQEFRQSILSRELGNKSDKRLALTAAIQLHHLREQLPQEVSFPFDEISEFVPELELLAAVANAAKHRTLVNSRWKRLIHGLDSVNQYMVICIFEDEHGTYYHAVKAVLVSMVDGSRKDLLYVLTTVMNMWLQILPQLGLIEERTAYSFPRLEHVRREDASLLSLQVVKGIQATIPVMLQRYDYGDSSFVAVPIREGELKIYERGKLDPVLIKQLTVSTDNAD